MNSELLNKYFTLTDHQARQFAALDGLYHDWNEKINVISRKDIDNLYEHHILHSLAIAKFLPFQDATKVLDVGTGGGFPGIPLAILLPQCQFHLIDGVGKKIKVASEIAKSVGLDNVICEQKRAEELKDKYDFVVSRAALALPDLVKIIRKNISQIQHNALPNGLICLKGGALGAELHPFGKKVEVMPVSDFFKEEYFKEKKLVYLPL